MELGACVEVHVTHFTKEAAPSKGALSWCTAVELPAVVGGAGATGSSEGSGVTEEGMGESGGGSVVCRTWEALHSAWEGRTLGKLLWPWAGIALNPPAYKGMFAIDFISCLGDAVFNTR